MKSRIFAVYLITTFMLLLAGAVAAAAIGAWAGALAVLGFAWLQGRNLKSHFSSMDAATEIEVPEPGGLGESPEDPSCLSSSAA